MGALGKNIDELIATKGRKLVHFKLNEDKPSRDELKKAMLGPTGKLRAPTFRTGRTLVVGFDQGVYENLFA